MLKDVVHAPIATMTVPAGGTDSADEAQPSARPEPDTALSRLSGWGQYPVVRGHELRSEDLARITRSATLTRGLGRSYGDSSLPATERLAVAGSTLADRLLAFDPVTGVLRAEAGLSLVKLNERSLSRGWFTPVTPGTQFVTLGGMVAADVHGKNHHAEGCFGEHVSALRMRLADGRVLECSDAQERDLFRATLGGMGLTGHILEVEFRMHQIPSPWIWEESERLEDFDQLIDALHHASTWPYTVSWMDCLGRGRKLGRGILQKGRWAHPSEAPPRMPPKKLTVSVPFRFPNWAIETWLVRLFNAAWYQKHGRRNHRGIAHPFSFFYPLDAVLNWNRVYGRRGFTQYQCVLPESSRHAAPRRFLDLLTGKGGTPFLCVVKDCGAEGKGMLSFPKPGITFALDLPIRPDTQRLVDTLNEFVAAEGGRVYLAKDAFTRPEHYRAMEPRLEAWSAVRRKWDPHGRLRSAQSVRVLGDPA
jgi:decaprenylphospho-beta-D-ribofuranose 2-oxidase